MIRRRWELVRCRQGSGSTLVPHPTGDRYWRRRSAVRAAGRRTMALRNGMWFEVRPVAR